MTAAIMMVLAVGAALAFANGANDVGKGIATLVGSGLTDYRRAIAWGTLWTGVGGLLGALLGSAMLTTFGKGFLAHGTAPTFAAALATLIGAAGWVLFATRTGLPVSTTHAIVGSLVGVSMLAYGLDSVRWGTFGAKVALPLLATPLVSLGITVAILRLVRRRGSGVPSTDCVCAHVANEVAVATTSGHSLALLAETPRLHITTGSSENCAKGQPVALRLTINHLHWLTSGATSLARGLNDGPKIVALLAGVSVILGKAALSTPVLFGLVTLAMIGGSLLAGRRVSRVLAEKVTVMDHREGFAANLVTAGLVTVGAIHGLPMSTTHVSSGGIFGAGALRGSLNRKTLRDILLAWVVTLPGAAVIGMAAHVIIRLARL